MFQFENLDGCIVSYTCPSFQVIQNSLWNSAMVVRSKWCIDQFIYAICILNSSSTCFPSGYKSLTRELAFLIFSMMCTTGGQVILSWFITWWEFYWFQSKMLAASSIQKFSSLNDVEEATHFSTLIMEVTLEKRLSDLLTQDKLPILWLKCSEFCNWVRDSWTNV